MSDLYRADVEGTDVELAFPGFALIKANELWSARPEPQIFLRASMANRVSGSMNRQTKAGEGPERPGGKVIAMFVGDDGAE